MAREEIPGKLTKSKKENNRFVALLKITGLWTTTTPHRCGDRRPLGGKLLAMQCSLPTTMLEVLGRQLSISLPIRTKGNLLQVGDSLSSSRTQHLLWTGGRIKATTCSNHKCNSNSRRAGATTSSDLELARQSRSTSITTIFSKTIDHSFQLPPAPGEASNQCSSRHPLGDKILLLSSGCRPKIRSDHLMQI